MTSPITVTHTDSRTTQKTVGEKSDARYVFYELTRSICPICRRAIDAGYTLIVASSK